MGRYYHLSKKISHEDSERITEEIKHLEYVKSVQMDEKNQRIMVETEDEDYQLVMSTAVNICSRMADGVKLSFSGFAFEN